MRFRGNVRFGGESGNRSRKATSVDEGSIECWGTRDPKQPTEVKRGRACQPTKRERKRSLDTYVKVLQKMRGEVRPPVHEQLLLTLDELEAKRKRKLGDQVLRDAADASNSTGDAIDVLDARCDALEPFVVSFDL